MKIITDEVGNISDQKNLIYKSENRRQAIHSQPHLGQWI